MTRVARAIGPASKFRFGHLQPGQFAPRRWQAWFHGKDDRRLGKRRTIFSFGLRLGEGLGGFGGGGLTARAGDQVDDERVAAQLRAGLLTPTQSEQDEQQQQVDAERERQP